MSQATKSRGLHGDIRLHMCDGRVYYPIVFMNVVATRTLLYPLAVVRTRLQIQNKGVGYKGTFNALCTILKQEGAAGLYKGYIVNILHCVPYFIELTTVERVRQAVLKRQDNLILASFCGGIVGGFLGQLLACPLDVLSQHMMLVGQKMQPGSAKPSQIERIHVPETVNRSSNLSVARYLINEIYLHEKLRGYYRGFFLSTLFVSYNAGLWWSFYYFYQGISHR